MSAEPETTVRTDSVENSTYRSGQSRDWIKVKTAAWREANRDRHGMFEKKRAQTQPSSQDLHNRGGA